jgi:hypothetical protein
VVAIRENWRYTGTALFRNASNVMLKKESEKRKKKEAKRQNKT